MIEGFESFPSKNIFHEGITLIPIHGIIYLYVRLWRLSIVIREFSTNDLNSLINLLQQGYLISTEEATSEFTGDNRKIYIYDDGTIKGFALTTLENKETNFCKIRIYVGKPYRHNGIGKKLHEEALKYAKKQWNSKGIAVGFVTSKDDSTKFFKSLNYEKWFTYHDMTYSGGAQPEPGLNFINYEDKYFEKYITLEGEAFYNLRRANDIKPYNCSDFSEASRNYCKDNSENIFLLLDDEDEIISTIYIKNGLLDEIMVSKKYEGQGYGCKTTQFGINKALSQGAKTVELSAVDWNKRAIYIYEALGFKIIQTFNNYRQFFR